MRVHLVLDSGCVRGTKLKFVFLVEYHAISAPINCARLPIWWQRISNGGPWWSTGMQVRDDETRGPLRPTIPPCIHRVGRSRAMRIHRRFSVLICFLFAVG